MYSRILLLLSILFTVIGAKAEPIIVAKNITSVKSNWNMAIANSLYLDPNCVMRYDPAQVDANGAAFSFDFVNPGGAGYKGYPSGVVGGVKVGGVYLPGNVVKSGMPVKIPDLNYDLRIRWKVSQQNANDADDKWWASINVIFDGGTATSEPISEERDYDLVIALKQYEQEDLTNKEKVAGGGAYWFFARNSDGSLKTLDLNYSGTVYKFAVRYKFFDFPEGHASYFNNNKVHVKFIPVDNDNCAPYLDHSLKLFVETTKNFIQYANLPADELKLANLKVANENLFVKSISAGYEVYTGSFTINNDYFYTILDTNPPVAPTNLTISYSDLQAILDWDDDADSDLDSYKVYRSENGSDFVLFADNLLTSSFVDHTVTVGNQYQYYVVSQDRSFNISDRSKLVTKPEGIAPASPQNLQLKQVSNTMVLDWDDNTESDFVNYKLYRSQNEDGFVELADNLAVSKYEDQTVQLGTTVAYYVVAVDKSFNESEKSLTVTGVFEKPTIDTNIHDKSVVVTNLASEVDRDVITILQNSTTETFSVQAPFTIKEVNIVGLNGKIARHFVKPASVYSFSSLNSGLYLVQIIAVDGSVYVRRLIVNRRID